MLLQPVARCEDVFFPENGVSYKDDVWLLARLNLAEENVPGFIHSCLTDGFGFSQGTLPC